MQILFLSHYFPPEVNAPASRTFDHARRWVKEPDISVTVLTNHPNHPYGILYEGYENRWLTSEKKEGIEVRRVKTWLAPNAGFIRRILNYLFFIPAAVIASAALPAPDIVVATSPQFFCAAAGFLISRLKRRPFVFELRDIWPESIVSVGAMKPGAAIRILEKLELFLYGKAVKIVVLTESFRRNLISRGIPDDKIAAIRNGADLSFFYPRPAPSYLIETLGAKGKFIVSYIGTVGMAHAVEKILNVAEELRQSEDILFLIVGEGAQKQKIGELVKRKGLSNVRVLPGVSKAEVPDYYALTDLNLVTLRNSPVFRTVLPSKIFEIMAMSKPILCAVDGECRQMIEDAGCGVFAEPENVRQIAGQIRQLRNRREKLRAMGENGRRFAERFFNRDDLARRYLDVLKDSVK